MGKSLEERTKESLVNVLANESCVRFIDENYHVTVGSLADNFVKSFAGVLSNLPHCYGLDLVIDVMDIGQDRPALSFSVYIATDKAIEKAKELKTGRTDRIKESQEAYEKAGYAGHFSFSIFTEEQEGYKFNTLFVQGTEIKGWQDFMSKSKGDIAKILPEPLKWKEGFRIKKDNGFISLSDAITQGYEVFLESLSDSQRSVSLAVTTKPSTPGLKMIARNGYSYDLQEMPSRVDKGFKKTFAYGYRDNGCLYKLVSFKD
jgi:hypothetical protein